MLNLCDAVSGRIISTLPMGDQLGAVASTQNPLNNGGKVSLTVRFVEDVGKVTGSIGFAPLDEEVTRCRFMSGLLDRRPLHDEHRCNAPS